MDVKKRNKKINSLVEKGFSYGTIAKLVKLSRARVHQIYSGYKPKDIRWIKLKNKILIRDSFVCQWTEVCKGGFTVKDLIVHHIDFDNRNMKENNLITLCKKCHAGFHSNNHVEEYREKNLTTKKNKVCKDCIVCGKRFCRAKSISKRQNNCSKKCAYKGRSTKR